EPQHALMGPITPKILDTMEIPSELFPVEPIGVGPALDRALAHMDATERPYALLMQKGSVAPHKLDAETPVSKRSPATKAVSETRRVSNALRPARSEALRAVIAHTPVDSTVVLASTGFCGR